MLSERERAEIDRLWQRKQQQDAEKLPQSQRHRNLEPDSAEFLHTLAVGVRPKLMLEIGGSSGLSTIALASAARQVNAKLISLEIEPQRQSEARETIARLGLSESVDFRLADAAEILPTLPPLDLVLIDCEKDDYARFFDMLVLHPESIVVADNILSHDLGDYVRHVRAKGYASITLPVGKGLEVTTIAPSEKGTK